MCLNIEVARKAWSTSLCGLVEAVPRVDEEEHLSLAPLCANYLQMFAHLREGCDRCPGEPPMLCFIFEVAKQARSLSHCGPMQAVPSTDEAEQQLNRLAASV